MRHLTQTPRAIRRRFAVLASVAVLGAVSLTPASAFGVTTRTAKGNCYVSLLAQSSITVTWELSDLLVNARAIKTQWGGAFGVVTDKVVTDEAFAGVLVTGGRKTWTGPQSSSGSHSYVMPWSTISNGHGRTDVNVSLFTGGIKRCSVRIPVPV